MDSISCPSTPAIPAGIALDRDSLAAALARGVRRFDGCAFDEQDLSRLDLQDCSFI